jgi:hypothetical protein
MQDSKNGADSLGEEFEKEGYDGAMYYSPRNTKIKKLPPSTAFLMSIYDEYIIAYKDRSVLGAEHYAEKFLALGNALTAVILIDGKIIGTWKRTLKKNIIEAKLDILKKINEKEYTEVSRAGKLYADFLGLELQILDSR